MEISTNPIRCILIDDEPKALTSFAYELAQLAPRVNLVQQFTHAEQARQWLLQNPIDLVFLDINMPGLNGLQWLDSLESRPFDVILSTAHSDYAIEAIKRHVSGYLMKPTDPIELERLISDLEELKKSRIMQNKEVQPINKTKKIQVHVDRKIVFLDPQQITYCHSDGNYSHVFIPPEKPLLLTQQLGQFAQQLPTHMFCRVHHSYIVNLQRVQEMHKTESYLVMDTGDQVPVSRSKRKWVINALEILS
jgi:two-component system LytT family response regulator